VLQISSDEDREIDRVEACRPALPQQIRKRDANDEQGHREPVRVEPDEKEPVGGQKEADEQHQRPRPRRQAVDSHVVKEGRRQRQQHQLLEHDTSRGRAECADEAREDQIVQQIRHRLPMKREAAAPSCAVVEEKIGEHLGAGQMIRQVLERK
jgi:hypothetical protein